MTNHGDPTQNRFYNHDKGKVEETLVKLTFLTIVKAISASAYIILNSLFKQIFERDIHPLKSFIS